MAERLYRSRDDRMLAGVAAGVAHVLDADPSIVRIAWALLAILTGGIAIVVYIVMAIVVPEGPGDYPNRGPSAATGSGPSPRPGGAAPGTVDGASTSQGLSPAPPSWTSDREARRAARRARQASGEPGRAGLITGLVLIVIGGFFLIREFVPGLDWQLLWPIGLIGLGVLLLVVALTPGRSSD